MMNIFVFFVKNFDNLILLNHTILDDNVFLISKNFEHHEVIYHDLNILVGQNKH